MMKNITIHPEITMLYNLGYDSLGWRRKKCAIPIENYYTNTIELNTIAAHIVHTSHDGTVTLL